MYKIRTKRNRTSLYLGKIVNLYGSTFIKMINSLTNYAPAETGHSIIEYSIIDLLYYRAKKRKWSPYLFITIDKKGVYNTEKGMYVNKTIGEQRFRDFISYIRKHSNYVDDYWSSSTTHVIVMKCPIIKSYNNFMISRYSKMYSTTELKELKIFPTVSVGGETFRSSVYIVLAHSEEYGKKVLADTIYENFGVNTVPDNPDEYDIPWIPSEEILNYEYITDEEKKEVYALKRNTNDILS